jgi:20S proteasome alpha/beta subunit
LCLPLMRKAGSDLSKEEATKVMEDCLRVLFYRNTKSSTRVRSDPPSFPFPSILCDTPS